MPGRAAWLHHCRVHYWGDIDTHGFAILHPLRAHLPGTRSILMDRTTLLAFEAHWGGEERPTLRRGFEADFSEVFLHYGAERYISFRPGLGCSAALLKRAYALFDAEMAGVCRRIVSIGWTISWPRPGARAARRVAKTMPWSLPTDRLAEQARRKHLTGMFPKGPATPALRHPTANKGTIFEYIEVDYN